MSSLQKFFASLCILSLSIIPFSKAYAQPTTINYFLKVDTADLSGYNIEIHIRNAPGTFHLAMATHTEYDDRYWRFVEDFSVEPGNSFTREDSSLWRINISDKDAIIKYRIHMPVVTGARPGWRPFLSSTGGMVGDMHSFMYLVEQPKVPCFITFQLPGDWQIATGLEPTKEPNKFYAANAKTLLDCPALIGKFKAWDFPVKNVPHKIVYWQLPDAKAFDADLMVSNIKKIVQQAVKLFDTIPYQHYTFLLQDGAYGALEHGNSVTIGIPSATFERDITETNQEIAHEFFHTWNLMHLRPAEYSELNYGPQEKASGVWWSEGLSLFYADLLLRRAKLSVYDSTRIYHLKKLIERYFSNPGNAKFSAEKASLESNAQPGGLGDYSVSVHLQGEVLGAMLDLIIRDATNGRSSIDDVMRKMFHLFSGKKGFYSRDIEQTTREVCNCDVHPFFEKYVYKANTIDFNEYLELIGKHLEVSWIPAVDDNGKPYPALLNIYRPAGDTGFNILIQNPESCWAKAGLHTNDKVISINDLPVTSIQTWRNIQRSLTIGDKVTVEVKHDTEIKKISVTVTGYNNPSAHISSLKNITPKQQRISRQWNDLD